MKIKNYKLFLLTITTLLIISCGVNNDNSNLEESFVENQVQIINEGIMNQETSNGELTFTLYNASLLHFNGEYYKNEKTLYIYTKIDNDGSEKVTLSTCDSALLYGEYNSQYTFNLLDCRYYSIYPGSTESIIYTFSFSDAYANSITWEQLSEDFTVIFENNGDFVKYLISKEEVVSVQT